MYNKQIAYNIQNVGLLINVLIPKLAFLRWLAGVFIIF